MAEENALEVTVTIESAPLRIAVTKRCAIGDVGKTVDAILAELATTNRKLPQWAKVSVAPVPITAPVTVAPSAEDPTERVANRLDIDAAKLRDAKLFGIKGEKVQIFKAQKFAPFEAVLAISFVSEIGIGKTALSYEELKEAYQESHIKSGSPLYMIISNIGNQGYIDKKRYESQKEIVLIAKGVEKVKEAIEKALSS